MVLNGELIFSVPCQDGRGLSWVFGGETVASFSTPCQVSWKGLVGEGVLLLKGAYGGIPSLPGVCTLLGLGLGISIIDELLFLSRFVRDVDLRLSSLIGVRTGDCFTLTFP